MNWASRGNKEPDKNKQLHVMSVKEYEELEDELAKYKRAFEIFKGREVQVYPKFDGNTQYVITLNKEEYELLEELMKGERKTKENN